MVKHLPGWLFILGLLQAIGLRLKQLGEALTAVASTGAGLPARNADFLSSTDATQMPPPDWLTRTSISAPSDWVERVAANRLGIQRSIPPGAADFVRGCSLRGRLPVHEDRIPQFTAVSTGTSKTPELLAEPANLRGRKDISAPTHEHTPTLLKRTLDSKSSTSSESSPEHTFFNRVNRTEGMVHLQEGQSTSGGTFSPALHTLPVHAIHSADMKKTRTTMPECQAPKIGDIRHWPELQPSSIECVDDSVWSTLREYERLCRIDSEQRGY